MVVATEYDKTLVVGDTVIGLDNNYGSHLTKGVEGVIKAQHAYTEACYVDFENGASIAIYKCALERVDKKAMYTPEDWS